ncbi:MAG: cytochrome c biogenesis protein CcsA [Coriobacteriia bacterium]|nr:cytochrome c biogenesis protein CcsA [Coriobacteriia bacterium]
MEQAAVVSFWFAMALYLVATVLYSYHFVAKRPVFSWYATFATGAGFLAHTASIGLHWGATGETPITGSFNSLSLTAWTLVLIYFVVEHLVKLKLYGAVLVPLAFLAMATGQVLLGSESFELGEAAISQLDSWRVGMHVALIMIANASFAVGAAASGVYLLQGAQLKKHKTSALMKRLPSLTQTQMLARRAIMLAYPLYTAGMLLGIVRAIEFDLNWWFDPRVMMSGVVWAIYGSYLLLHYRRGASGKLLARLALVGLVAVIVLAIIARTVPTGFHIFGL